MLKNRDIVGVCTMPGIFCMLALPCGVLKKLSYRYSVKICGMYLDLQVFCIAFIAFPMEIELKIMLAGYPVGKACPSQAVGSGILEVSADVLHPALGMFSTSSHIVLSSKE